MSRVGRMVAVCGALLVLAPGAGAQDAFEEARALLDSGALTRARSAFETLARAGDARAQDALAGMLVAGVGGRADREAAMSWYCVLAHQPQGGREVVHALWLLAEYFRTGGGLPGWRYNEGSREREDPVRAYFWFRLLQAQPDHYQQVVADAVKLGALGSDAVGRQLLEGEKQLVARRLERWTPEPASVDRERCLRLPED